MYYSVFCFYSTLHVRLSKSKHTLQFISFNCCLVVHGKIESHFIINPLSNKEHIDYFQFFQTINYTTIMYTPSCSRVKVSWKHVSEAKSLDCQVCAFFNFTRYCQVVLTVVVLLLALYSSTIPPYHLTST